MREGKKSLFPHPGHLSVKEAADGSRKLVQSEKGGPRREYTAGCFLIYEILLRTTRQHKYRYSNTAIKIRINW